mgnify:CR=1 FL=1
MKEKQSKKELAGILFFLLGAGMLVSSAFLCVGSDIWYDEVFSLFFSQQVGAQSSGTLHGLVEFP